MRVAIIYNKDLSKIINVFGMQNKEIYNPATVKKVAVALEKGGHNVEIIDGNMDVVENIRNFLPKVQDGEKFGIVFNMAYGIQGESRYTHVPAMLEMLGIPYVGSSPSGHALALDKVITKIILQRNNIPTPDFWVFSSKNESMDDVEFPVIVKPKMESVSFGLKVVNNIPDLKEAVDFIVNEFNQQALVEKFIRGREFAVGLLGNDPVEAFSVLEIDLEGDPDAIQTVDDKKHKPKRKICPADISPELTKEMQELSINVFKVLGLRDFSRVDIRLSEDNKIYILEVNSMASLGASGSYVKAAEVMGYDFDALANRMLEVASMRYFANEVLVEREIVKSKKISLPVKIRSYLRTKYDITEKFLQEIVDLNTYVKNIEGVNKLGMIVRKRLNSLGFHSEIFPQNEIGNMYYFTNSDTDEVDILLMANLDNAVRLNKQKYFRKTEHKLFGSGIWEHKSGIAVMLLALQSLKYIRLLNKIKIGIVLTTDDTLQRSFSKEIIEKKSAKAKYVFGMHGASLDGAMVTSRSGSAIYNFEMNLKNCSGAMDVSKAVNVFSKIVSEWAAISDEEKGVLVAPKNMNMQTNITDPYFHGELHLDVKFNKNEIFQEVDQKIRKLIPRIKYKNLFDFQLEGGEKRPALKYTEKTNDIMERTKAIARKLDIRIESEHRWSSADICLVSEGKYILDGFGPGGIKEYNGDEYILKHNLIEKSLLLALLLNEVSNKI